MFPSTQIILIFTIFITALFCSQVESAKNRNDKSRAIFLKNCAQFVSVFVLFFTSIIVNHHISSELSFFDALHYTISDPTEVIFETIIYTGVLFLFIILLKIEYGSKEMKISKVQITAPIVASTAFMILATTSTSNDKEFDLEYIGYTSYNHFHSKSSHNQTKPDPISFLKEKCPKGIRIEPNFKSYKVTCYDENLFSTTIKFSYNSNYSDYFSNLTGSEESILDYTHDLYYYDYDSTNVIVRALSLDKSKRVDEYNDAYRELLYYGIRSMSRSVYWTF